MATIVKKPVIEIDNSWKTGQQNNLPEGITPYSFKEFQAEGFEVNSVVRRKQTFLRNSDGKLVDVNGKLLKAGQPKVKTPAEDCPLCLDIFTRDEEGNIVTDDNGRPEIYASANLSPAMKETHKVGDKLTSADFGIMYYEEGTTLQSGTVVSKSFLQITRPGGSMALDLVK